MLKKIQGKYRMHRYNNMFFTVLLVCALLLTGCNQLKDRDTSESQIQDSSNEEVKSLEPLYKDATKPAGERAADLLSRMSLEEKAGQMVQGVRTEVTGKDMTELGLGSILSGGGSYPGNNTLEDWNKMITGFQEAAMKTRYQIPMLYGVDAVHGHSLVYGAVVFPHNIGLGAANDADLMYQMGGAVAEELKLTGILWNFAPCVAVSRDPRWGRTYESFSSDPKIVTALAEAYVKGQTDHGVAPTAKHYVGDGGTVYGTGEDYSLIDRGNVTVSEEELRETHLLPYKKLVDSGIKMVMASFSSYQGVKMHENKYLLTDVLKKELGFQGFIVSDWEAVNELSGKSLEEKVLLAVNAGVDMLMEPTRYKSVVEAITDGVKQGLIPEERVDDAVSRILTVKFEMGLFEDPYQEKVPHEVTELGSSRYKELAKKLVEKSLVLLKNDDNTLPLKKGEKLFVTGPAINDMGLQCGGWGHTWQGVMDEGGNKVTKGSTLLDGLIEYGKKYGYEIITDKDRIKEADAVILALGEIPYAEFQGDTKDLSITGALGHKENKAAIQAAKELGKPTIALIVAGRNVLIKDYIKDWDSVVMCYLPGSEGDGIASVLSGETGFTGKLPMPYYKGIEDIGKKDADLLFNMGYGLTY
jgi:beta-glucosidase